MKRALGILAIALFFTPSLLAQAAPQMPQPAPELKNFSYFTGSWTIDGDMKPSPWGPGGKFTGSEHNEWMDGNFFLVSHSTYNSPMGAGKGLAVMGYNHDDKVYTYDAFDSMGEYEHATGTLSGDTWDWYAESKMAGKIVKGHYVQKVLSPTSYSFKYEIGTGTGQWAPVMEGKATKSK
jgi:Protein of unknown function (DUF1579)